MVDIVEHADAFIDAVAQNVAGARTTDSIARELADALAKTLEQQTSSAASQALPGGEGIKELVASLNFILFARATTLQGDLYTVEANKLMAQLEAHMQQHGAAVKATRPDVVDYRKTDPQTFYDEYVVKSRIALIKNFDCVAWKEWSVDWFVKRFGDEKFPLLKLGDSPDLFVLPDFTEEVPLRLLLEERDKYYFANSQVLFDRHPDLHEELNLPEIARFMKPTGDRVPLKQESQQFFISTGPRAATGVHNGHNCNFFFNVQGVKKWTLVHPEFSFMMCAWLRPFDGICAFHLMNDFAQSWIPTLKNVPYYKVILRPGDVLYNPYYWWHSVESLSTENVGISTRWLGTPGQSFQDPFPVASLATKCNRVSRQAYADAERDRDAGIKTNWFDRISHGRSIEFGFKNGMEPWGLKWGRPPAREV